MAARPAAEIVDKVGAGEQLWEVMRLSDTKPCGRILRARSGQLTVWVKCRERIQLDGTVCELGFHRGNLLEFHRIARPNAITPAYLRSLAEDRNMVVQIRHGDLHTGNILAGDGALKLIDLGEFRRTMSITDRARLEVSLWHRLTGREDKLGFEHPNDVPEFLATLQSGRRHSNWPDRVRFFWDLLRAVRGSSSDVNDADRALAYTAQVLYHYRYGILNASEVPEPTHEVSDVFGVMTDYWFRELRLSLGDEPRPDAHAELPAVAGRSGRYCWFPLA